MPASRRALAREDKRAQPPAARAAFLLTMAFTALAATLFAGEARAQPTIESIQRVAPLSPSGFARLEPGVNTFVFDINFSAGVTGVQAADFNVVVGSTTIADFDATLETERSTSAHRVSYAILESVLSPAAADEAETALMLTLKNNHGITATASGNAALDASSFPTGADNETYTIDRKPPTISAAVTAVDSSENTVADGTPWPVGETYTVTWEFSEPLIDFTDADIALDAPPAGLGLIVENLAPDDDRDTYKADLTLVGDPAADATARVQLARLGFSDRAGNNIAADDSRLAFSFPVPDPALSRTLVPQTISEDGGEAVLTVIRNRPVSEPTTVTFTYDYGTGIADREDFTLTDDTITIPAGFTSASTTITAVNDEADTANKTLAVTATVGSLETSAILTIVDNDPPPGGPAQTVTISSADAGTMIAEVSDAYTTSFTVTRAGGDMSAELVVNIAGQLNGKNQNELTTTVTIPADMASVTGSTSMTGSEVGNLRGPYFVVRIYIASNENYQIGTPGDYVATIRDGDFSQSGLIVESLRIPEDGGTTTIQVETLTPVRNQARVVRLRIGASDATNAIATNAGFTLSATQFTVAVGQTLSDEITLTATDDTESGDKTVQLGLSSDFSGNLNNLATLTILDDEPPNLPVVTIAAGAATYHESSGVIFTLTRTGDLTAALPGVQVETTDRDGAATIETIAFGPDGATIEHLVPKAETAEKDGPTSVKARVLPGAGYTVGDPAAAAAAIEDSQTELQDLVLSPAAVDEGGTSTLWAILSSAVTRTTTVTLSHNGAADALELPETLTIPANMDRASVTVTAAENDRDAPHRHFRITATAAVMVSVDDDPPTTTNSAAAAILTVADNDLPQVAITGPGIVDEGATGEHFTLTRVGDAGVALTVNLAITGRGGTAVTPAPTATIAAGRTTAMVSLDAYVAQNDDVDGATTVIASIAESDAYRRAPGADTATVYVADDEATVTLSLSPATISEDGGVSRLTATLTSAAAEDTTVTLAATPLGDAVAGDYALGATSLTIPMGLTSASTTITATPNDVHTVSKTVKIAATLSGATDSAPTPVFLTLKDNDPPLVTIGGPADQVVMGARTGAITGVEYTLSRTGDTSEALEVSLAYRTDISSNLGTDPNRIFTGEIPMGSSEATVTFDLASNFSNGPAGTVIVGILPEPDYRIGTPDSYHLEYRVTGFSFAGLVISPLIIPEAGGVATVKLVLHTPAATDITRPLIVNSAGTTAVRGTDYTLSGTEFTVPMGETDSSNEITITALDDATDNADLRLAIQSESGDGTPLHTLVLRIRDDDPAAAATLPEVTIAAAAEQRFEDSGSSASVSFHLTRTGDTTAALDDVRLEITVRDGSFFNTTVDLPANNTAPFYNVSRTDAGLDDNDQAQGDTSVSARVLPGVGYTVGDPAAAATTILDDDITLDLALSAPTIPEGGTSTLYATLSSSASLTTTVTLSHDGAADALNLPETLTIMQGMKRGSVSVTAADNDLDQPDQSFVITAATAIADADDIMDATATLAVADNDLPLVGIAGPGFVDEDSTGNEFTLTRFGDTTPALMVDLEIAGRDGQITAMDDVEIAAGDATKTIAFDTYVAGNDDNDGPTRVAARIVANSDRYRRAAADVARVTVVDDEMPLTLSLSSDAISEDGGAATVSATLAEAVDADTIVALTATPGPGATAGDFTLADASLTIRAGLTAASTTITAVGNDVDAADKTVLVSAEVTGGVTTAPAPVLLTLADNDLPLVTVSGLQEPVMVGDAGLEGRTAFTVTRQGDLSADLTVKWRNSVNGGADFSPMPDDVVIPAGSATANASAVGTNYAARNILFAFVRPDPAYRIGAPNLAFTTVVRPNYDRPTLVVSPTHISENLGTATIQLLLPDALAPADETMITLGVNESSTSHTATSGDYQLPDTTLTITAGATMSDEVTITAVNNDAAAADKRVILQTVAAGEITSASTGLLILDDDAAAAPVITIAADQTTVAEGTAVAFTVTRAGGDATAALDDVRIETTGRDGMIGSTVVDVDFGASETTKTFMVANPVTPAPAGVTSITARVLAADGYTVGDPATAATMITDASVITPTLALSAATIDEDGGATILRAFLPAPAPEDLTLALSAAYPDSKGFTDFFVEDATLLDTGLMFAEGATASANSITLTAKPDNTTTGTDPEVTFTLAAQMDVTGEAVATLTISEQVPVVYVDQEFPIFRPDSDVSELIRLTVSPRPPPGLMVNVEFTVRDSEPQVLQVATDGATPVGANAASKAFGELAGDDIINTVRTVSARVLPGDGYVIATDRPNFAFTTIVDNDAVGDNKRPYLTAPNTAIPEGDSVEISATFGFSNADPTMSERPTADGQLTLEVMSATGPAGQELVAGTDYEFTGTPLSFQMDGQSPSGNYTLRSLVDNDQYDGPRTIVIRSLANPAAGLLLPSIPLTFTIVDDDLPAVTVAGPATAAEGTDFDFTFTRTGNNARALPIGVEITDRAGDDDTVTVTFAADSATAVHSVTGTGNEDFDGPTGISARVLPMPAAEFPDDYAVGDPDAATVMITDDEPPLTLALESATIAEDGGETEITVTLSRAAPRDVAVTLTLTPGPGTRPADYEISETTLVIPTPFRTARARIRAMDNDLGGVDGTVTIAATAPGVTAPASALLTITNDDAGGTDPAPAPAIALPSVGSVTRDAGAPYTLNLPEATGGAGTPAYTLTGDRPAGLTFDGNARPPTLSGTPNRAGTFPLTYTVTDAGGNTVSRPFTVTIRMAWSVPERLATGTLRFEDLVDNPVAFPAITAGATGTVTYALESVDGRDLPDWLPFNAAAASRELSLTDIMLASGAWTLRYTATDPGNSDPATRARALTVVLGDDPARRQSRLGEMVGAVGRALGWDMAGVIRNRARGARSGTDAPLRMSGVSEDTTLDDLVSRGASVDIALNANAADEGRGGSAGYLWAKVGRSEFDNEPLNDYEQDGSLTSVHAGVDFRAGRDRLFGAAIGWHDAEVDYEDRDARVEGDLGLELLTVNPYASQTRDRWHAWGTLGFGTGTMTYAETSQGGGEQTSESDVTLLNAAGGLEYTADTIGKADLVARGEGMFLTMDVDGADNDSLKFEPFRSDVYGVRGEVEIGLPMNRADGGTLRPFVVMGMRWEDGDDAASGWAAELGGGITARNRDFLVGADLRARTSADDEAADVLAWNVSLGFDRANDNRGFALELRHKSGPQPWDPFADDGLAAASDTSADTEATPATLGATTRYGLDYRNGRMTPYNTLSFDGDLLTEVETGIQYRLSDLSLGLKHVYEPAADPADVDQHTLKLTGQITF